MALKDQIERDFLAAYKGREELVVSVLRMIKSDLKNAEIQNGRPLSDEEIIKILRREVKQREDARIEFQKGNRQDLIEKDKKEIEIIGRYLPAPMDQKKIKNIVKEAISEIDATGPADIGRVIGASMKKAGGMADGSVIANIVKELLNQK